MAVLAASAALTGCVGLGGNVKGSFSCAAPDGICAPSSVIDDRALAMISGTTDVVPAGPYTPDRDASVPVRVAGNGSVRRTDQKVLKIVFPAHVDARGRYYETSAIRAVVDNGAWLAASEPKDGEQVALAAEPTEPADARLALAGTVDLATAVAQAPSAPTVPVSITREGLKAEVDQMLGKAGTVTPASAAVARPPKAAPPVAAAGGPAAVTAAGEPSHGIVLPPVAASAGAVVSAPPVNRPTAFSGLERE
jgi:conjugal transfer pilus assembly protein TraV